MVLGFDFGMKYIGVASGQEITKTATPLTCLKATNGIPNWDAIEKLISTWQPNALIVGIPPTTNAKTELMFHRINKFANRLHAKFKLPVHLVDENLSTWEAKHLLATNTLNKQALNELNSLAAAIILEQWLNK